MWTHVLPTHTPNVKHLGCLQAPPPEIIMQRTPAHVTWWSCVKRPLKYISRDRMLIHDLRDLFYSSIHWFLKRMNPPGVRRKDSMRMDYCFFQKTWLRSGLTYPQTDRAPPFNLYTTLSPSPTPLPLAPNYELSPGSAFSQELSPLLASASTSMQVSWCFSNMHLKHW